MSALKNVQFFFLLALFINKHKGRKEFPSIIYVSAIPEFITKSFYLFSEIEEFCRQIQRENMKVGTLFKC